MSKCNTVKPGRKDTTYRNCSSTPDYKYTPPTPPPPPSENKK